jgi:predicted nucleotidyltransferase
MPKYTLDEQDDLEDAAEAPRPDAQSKALQLIAQILEQHSIAYAVMGGMNVFLRGSLRTTTDVDIAVDNPPKMEVLLDIFNDHSK